MKLRLWHLVQIFGHYSWTLELSPSLMRKARMDNGTVEKELFHQLYCRGTYNGSSFVVISKGTNNIDGCNLESSSSYIKDFLQNVIQFNHRSLASRQELRFLRKSQFGQNYDQHLQFNNLNPHFSILAAVRFLAGAASFSFCKKAWLHFKMLQWMGGSRRKVTTSRKSTQNRQKQYFEQRKRRQQLSSGSENYHDAADTGKEQKQHRSLDILSFLNLSTIPPENKAAYTIEANTSTVRSHFMKDPAPTLYNIEELEKSAEFEYKQQNDETGAPSGYKEETLSQMKHVSNDPDIHNKAKNKVDSQSDQGMKSVEQSVSIFDLLGDDGTVCKSEGSPMKEAHVAFSVDGLGRVGLETPACSPQHASRSISYGFSSHLERMRPGNSLKNITVLDDFELEGDIIMQDMKGHRDDSCLNYSLGMMDTCDNPKKKSPAKSSFRSFEDCKRNENGGRSIFDGMDGERDRLDGGFNFFDDDFIGEVECDFFEKNHFNEIGSVSSDFLNYDKYDISEKAFDSPYLPKKRCAVATKTMGKFSLFGNPPPLPSPTATGTQFENLYPVKSSSKHHTLGCDYDLLSDAKRNPKATRISDFEDKSLHPDWFCSIADHTTDNFSSLSEESCSTSAVRGEAFNSTPLNPKPRQNMRRAMGDDSIYSRDPHYKIRDEVNRGDHAQDPEKYVRKSNSSKFKPIHRSNSPFMEKLQPFKSWSFEKECNLSSPCQSPAADRPFRGSMPWSEYPCAESALPESSFTNKYFETLPHPSSSSISKRHSFKPSNIASGDLERELCSNSKLAGTYTSLTEATSSHGEYPISPVLSAQGSVGTGEKSVSKVPSLDSEKIDFHEEKCTRTRRKKKVCVDDTDCEWLDDSNHEKKNCDSIRNETENESLPVENLEASHHSDQVKNGDKAARSSNDDKFNQDDEVSVPCSRGEKEVKDIKVEVRKMRSKSCSMDQSSNSQVMMLESYVLQLLYVQKVLLKQASSPDFMKNA